MNPEPLNFSETPQDLATKSLSEVVASIIENYGQDGCTMEDVAGTIQRNAALSQRWSPKSASPSVSGLVAIGVVREERRFGVRRLFHVRPFERDQDPGRLTQHAKMVRRVFEERRRLTEEKPSPETAPTAKNGTDVGHHRTSTAKIMLAVGSKDTLVLTVAEAKDLLKQLQALFGG